jgi:hypothetical protein
MIVGGVLAAGLAGWLLWLSNHGRRGSMIPDDLDGQVLKQLTEAGSDLSRPHNIEFYLHFPDKEHAERACRTLSMDGYNGEVDSTGKGSGFMCGLTKRLVPSYRTMVNIRQRMDGLAKAGNGEYDGWGTSPAR